MKLIVIVNDSPACYEAYMYTGNLPQVKRRVVELELTAEQIKAIETMHRGEAIESVSFELQKDKS